MGDGLVANAAGGGAELSYALADLHGLGVVGPEELKAVVGSGGVPSVLAHVEDCKQTQGEPFDIRGRCQHRSTGTTF